MGAGRGMLHAPADRRSAWIRRQIACCYFTGFAVKSRCEMNFQSLVVGS
jgi:hypothetical protein